VEPARPPAFTKRIPAGDNRERAVCDHCGFVDYVNPRIVVGVVCTWGDQYLLCKRAIDPRKGFWTFPAGFLEQGESPEEGAAREAVEEAGADVSVGALLGIYSIPRIGQVQMMFQGELRSPEVKAGEESLEVRFVPWAAIPWDELAFLSVSEALRHHGEVRGRATFPAFRVTLGA
jgi:ADP-ribose pyrophosphatase YjhB (NUDIX family)